MSQSHNADGTIADNTIGDTQIASGSITDSHVSSFAAIAKTKLSPGIQTSLNLADSSVQTVNGKTPTAGGVSLTASDVGALTQTTADSRYIAGTEAASAPSSPTTDDLWYDKTNDVWKRWNGSSWVTATTSAPPGGVALTKVNDWAVTHAIDAFGTSTLGAGAVGKMSLCRVWLQSSATYDAIGVDISTVAAGGISTVNCGIFADDGSNYAPLVGSNPLASTGPSNGPFGSTGTKVFTLSATFTPPTDGFYWVGLAYFGSGVTTYPTFVTVTGAPFVSFGDLSAASNALGWTASQMGNASMTALGALSPTNAPWHIGIRRSA